MRNGIVVSFIVNHKMLNSGISREIEVKLEVSIKLKKQIGGLLSTLMEEYSINGITKEHTKAFKDCLKSNIYVLLDNKYHNKK